MLSTLDPSVDQSALARFCDLPRISQEWKGLVKDKRKAMFSKTRWTRFGAFVLGPMVAKTPANLSGGTWANIDDRNRFLREP